MKPNTKPAHHPDKPVHIPKKTVEQWSGTIIYNDDPDNPDYDTYQLDVNCELKQHFYMLKQHECWRSKVALVRYLENMIDIVKKLP
jgi:hypothetical protein